MLSIYGIRSDTQAALHAIQRKAWERTRVAGRWAFVLGALRSLVVPKKTNWWIYLYMLFLIVLRLAGRGGRVDWHGGVEMLAAMASGLVVTAFLIGVWGWRWMERRYRADGSEGDGPNAALVD